MDHVGVVVDDLEAAISFFVELGMELDGGTTPVEGDWVDRVVAAQSARPLLSQRASKDARSPPGRARTAVDRGWPKLTDERPDTTMPIWAGRR